MAKQLLKLENIAKSFPGVRALSEMNLELYEGEVLGLCGENGAGKSTLIKILSGLYQPDEGNIYLNGERVSIPDTHSAMEMGISCIYQELAIVPDLTVGENLFLGSLPKGRLRLVDQARLVRESREVLATLGMEQYHPDATRAGDLSIGMQQLVEIGKAIARKSRILIMDEPTSSLSQADTHRLFELIRSFKEKGYGIIFVSHHMEEIFEITDRVAVLRDGKLVEAKATSAWDTDSIVFAMVNRKVDQQFPRKREDAAIGEVLLKAEGLTNKHIHDISLEVRAGEIIGLAGIVGAGRTELLKTLYGEYPAQSGVMEIRGRRVSVRRVKTAMKHGLALVPEDRKKEGLLLESDIVENTLLPHYRKISRFFIVNQRKKREISEAGVSRYAIKTPSLSQKVNLLSGGNQQKVILSRVTYGKPAVFLLDEPTRGIDVGVKREMYQQMIEFAESGAAVIMASSELPEILGLADRVLVMHNRTIVANLTRAEATRELVMNYATGGQ